MEIPTGDTGDLAVVGRVETDTFINERMSSASPVAAVDGGSSSGHDIVIAATAGPDAPPDDGPPDTGMPEPRRPDDFRRRDDRHAGVQLGHGTPGH